MHDNHHDQYSGRNRVFPVDLFCLRIPAKWCHTNGCGRDQGVHKFVVRCMCMWDGGCGRGGKKKKCRSNIYTKMPREWVTPSAVEGTSGGGRVLAGKSIYPRIGSTVTSLLLYHHPPLLPLTPLYHPLPYTPLFHRHPPPSILFHYAWRNPRQECIHLSVSQVLVLRQDKSYEPVQRHGPYGAGRWNHNGQILKAGQIMSTFQKYFWSSA